MGGKIKIFYIFLFLLIPIKNFSQSKIIGFVKDSTNQTGILANVILKNSVDNSIVTFTSTNNDGSYLLEIENIGDFILSFSALSYETKLVSKTIVEVNEENSINVFLKSKSINLDEIVIQSKKPITVKKDTIVFNVKSFIQGNEDVVELSLIHI